MASKRGARPPGARRGPKAKALPAKFTLSAMQLYTGKWASRAEYLRHASEDEIRSDLRFIAALVGERRWEQIPPEWSQFLGAALEAIAEGEDPAVALGLKGRRTVSLGRLRSLRAAVDELHAQNIPQYAALGIVELLRRGEFFDGDHDLDDLRTAGEALRKALDRGLK